VCKVIIFISERGEPAILPSYPNTMNKTIQSLSIITIVLLIQNAFPHAVVNPGTVVPVKTTEKISSQKKTNPRFVVAQDVLYSDGSICIRHGTEVQATAEINRRRSAGRPGSINIIFEKTQTVDGKPVGLTGNYSITANDKRFISMTLTIGTLPLFPFNFLFLIVKGNPAIIEREKNFENVKTVSVIKKTDSQIRFQQ